MARDLRATAAGALELYHEAKTPAVAQAVLLAGILAALIRLGDLESDRGL